VPDNDKQKVRCWYYKEIALQEEGAHDASKQ
jgi:hypothetical protein